MKSPDHQDNATLGIALVITAMFIFSLQDAITKTLAVTYSVPQILWIRFVFYIFFALAISVRKKPLRDSLKSEVPWLQIFRSLLIVAEFGMFIVTIRYLSLAEMHALLATFPLVVTAIAAVFLKEPVGIRRWGAVFVGFLGVLVILRPGLAAIQPAALLALVTALTFAAYNVMTRLVSRYDDGETSTVYMAVVGLVVMTAIGPFYWETATPSDWGWLLALSI